MSRGQGRCVGSSGEERLWQGTSPDISGARSIKPGISALIALSCDPAIVSAWPLGLLGKGRRAWMTRVLTEQDWMRTQWGHFNSAARRPRKCWWALSRAQPPCQAWGLTGRQEELRGGVGVSPEKQQELARWRTREGVISRSVACETERGQKREWHFRSFNSAWPERRECVTLGCRF